MAGAWGAGVVRRDSRVSPGVAFWGQCFCCVSPQPDSLAFFARRLGVDSCLQLRKLTDTDTNAGIPRRHYRFVPERRNKASRKLLLVEGLASTSNL